MKLQVLDSISAVSADQWDALVGDHDPFAEHAFLRLLEVSGAVGPEMGWQPRHVTLWSQGQLHAALPLYEKNHSYGEYIFDWAWAEAAARARIAYYPKLVGMTPWTPATGRRLLYQAEADVPAVAAALLAGAEQVCERQDCASMHLLFVSEMELQACLQTGDRAVRWPTETIDSAEQLWPNTATQAAAKHWLPRLSHQFHWHNAGYRDFADFLGTLRTALRKQVRKERARARQSGLQLRVFTGAELADRHWQQLGRFYADTCQRKEAPAYLPAAFFEQIGAHCAHRVVVAAAVRDDDLVAASLNFEKGDTLYGRYWGCEAQFDSLHFELCYYQLIERAIDLGLRRVEAGAQGIHKLRRGFLPRPIHSLHWLRHPALAAAVADFLPREAVAVAQQMRALAVHGPFHRC